MRVLFVEVAPADQTNAYLCNGLGYIAAYLRKYVPTVEMRIIKGDAALVAQVAAEYHPEIVGISTVSQYYRIATEVAAAARKAGALVVIGGHHVSSLPDSITSAMDVAIIGEGEETFFELYQVYAAQGLDWKAFRNIPGLAFRDEAGLIVQTAPRPLHKNLDDFPFPARDLMHIRPGQSMGIISSRGCPYVCVFCASSAFWSSMRFHSPDYVVAELKEMAERYQTSHIYFWDDLFIANVQRIEAILKLVQNEPVLKGMKYSVTCRANLATDELARMLKEMNVVEVMLGLESMAPRTLKYLKPHVTVEQNRNAVDVLHRAGLNVTGFFVIGSPQEKREELEETLHFVKTAPLYRAEAYLLTPLPGTPVWDYAVQRGLLDPENVPWDRMYIDNPENPENGIHLSETMSPEELRGYWREFQKIRQAKDRRNMLNRVPQHLRHLIQAPKDEVALILNLLKTRRQGHI